MVRPMNNCDLQEFTSMCLDFYNSDGVLHPIPPENIANTFEQIQASNKFLDGVILEDDGVVCGYGLISFAFSNEAGGMVAWLEELYIKANYRSKGFGKEFFSYLEDSYAKSCKRFRLEVTASNTKAIALYKSLGYEVFDYLQMVRDIV